MLQAAGCKVWECHHSFHQLNVKGRHEDTHLKPHWMLSCDSTVTARDVKKNTNITDLKYIFNFLIFFL